MSIKDYNEKMATTSDSTFSRVAVIGAGVIGLSVATHLLEKFQKDLVVTIIAEKFSPNTISSDKSGGWIFPPLSSSETLTPHNPDRVVSWVKGTVEKFSEIYYSEECNEAGLSLAHGYLQSREIVPPYLQPNFESEKFLWTKFVQDFRYMPIEVSQSEVYDCDKPLLGFTTFIVPCPVYLPWLLKRFKGLGGVSKERKIHNFSELIGSYDIVINCTGLGARELANDPLVYPVRGHIVSVSAPWIKQWVVRRLPITGKSAYVFPRRNEVLLGGSFDVDNEDLTVDSNEVKKILEGCISVIPSLAEAEQKTCWAGVRPCRKGGIRLEKEEREEFVLIHCYGHGGDGVSLSWGCAIEVGTLVRDAIKF